MQEVFLEVLDQGPACAVNHALGKPRGSATST